MEDFNKPLTKEEEIEAKRLALIAERCVFFIKEYISNP